MTPAVGLEPAVIDRVYDAAAQRYLEALPTEHFMESTDQSVTFFWRRSARVGANGRRVEDQNVEVGVPEGRHDRIPAALLGPPIEPTRHSVVLAESFGRVLPGDAGAGLVQDRVDEESVILGDPTMLPRLAGKQVFGAMLVGVRDGVAVEHWRPSMKERRAAVYPDCPSRVHTT